MFWFLVAAAAAIFPLAGSADSNTPPTTALLSSRAMALNAANGKVYAVNERRGTVSIINGATDTTISVAVGAGPDALAINKLTGRVYVANSAAGAVSVLDGDKNTVLANVKAGPHPYMLAVDEANNKVYVTNTFSNQVGVIDGATNTVTLLKLGAADNVAINARSHRVLLLGYEDPNLRVLDVTTGAVEKKHVGEHVWGMAVNATTGAAYITRVGNSEMVEIDGHSANPITIPVGAIPCAVAIDEKRNMIYVVNYGDDTVSIMDGDKRRTITTVKVGSRPQALALDTKANRVYVANTHGDSVTVIDGNTKAVIATIKVGKNPFGIVVNAESRKLYTANLGNPSFTIVDLARLRPTPGRSSSN